MTTISPEAFMAQPSEPDEDVLEPDLSGREAFIAQAELVSLDVPDPLESMAESLRRLADHWTSTIPVAQNDDAVLGAMQELADLEAKYDTLVALVEEIEGIIKPSTSKLANSVRDAINAWRAPEVPAEPEVELVHGTPTGGKSPCGIHYMEGTFGSDPTCPECKAAEVPDNQPAHDADVEVWREYAITEGLPRDAAEGMNRSQIRTALGIEQPS